MARADSLHLLLQAKNLFAEAAGCFLYCIELINEGGFEPEYNPAKVVSFGVAHLLTCALRLLQHETAILSRSLAQSRTASALLWHCNLESLICSLARHVG